MPVEHVTAAVTDWAARINGYHLLEAYAAGRHELKFATPDWMSKYATQVLQGAVMSIRENLCPAVITGFTDSISIKSWGDDTDETAASEEGLSRLMGFVARGCFRDGDAFILAWPNNTGQVRASYQRARRMVPHIDPLNPGVLDRCAMVWVDTETGKGRVNLYYPDRLERWQSIGKLTTASTDATSLLPIRASAWQGCTDDDGDVVMHNMGAVPVCWLKLDADEPTGHGTSILNDVIPLQDGLNASLAHMLVNQEAYSRPFWYLLNYKPTEAPANPFLPDSSQRWPMLQTFDRTRQSIITHDGPGPFGQLDQPDLTRLLTVQEAFKAKVCSVVGIPAYTMQAEIGNVPSGAALRRLDARRANRIRAWQADSQPALRGLKHLLGMSDSPIEWEPVNQLDELERWEIARTQADLGYALSDILTWLGETDIDGILARAQQARLSNAAAMGQAFLDGQGAASYGG